MQLSDLQEEETLYLPPRQEVTAFFELFNRFILLNSTQENPCHLCHNEALKVKMHLFEKHYTHISGLIYPMGYTDWRWSPSPNVYVVSEPENSEPEINPIIHDQNFKKYLKIKVLNKRRARHKLRLIDDYTISDEDFE